MAAMPFTLEDGTSGMYFDTPEEMASGYVNGMISNGDYVGIPHSAYYNVYPSGTIQTNSSVAFTFQQNAVNQIQILRPDTYHQNSVSITEPIVGEITVATVIVIALLIILATVILFGLQGLVGEMNAWNEVKCTACTESTATQVCNNPDGSVNCINCETGAIEQCGNPPINWMTMILIGLGLLAAVIIVETLATGKSGTAQGITYVMKGGYDTTRSALSKGYHAIEGAFNEKEKKSAGAGI